MDLNADVGEGYGVWRLGDDAQLMPYLTSASVATGGHAGDPAVMWQTVEAARRHGVAVGAHVSYPDVRGFGRRRWEGDPGEMVAELVAQIGALDAICRAQGVPLAYVKPHGTLYHDVNWDRRWQQVLEAVLTRLSGPKAVMVQANTPAVAWFQAAGFTVIREGFCDRGYLDDGRLVPRGQPGALRSLEEAVEQAVRLATEGVVITQGGHRLPLAVDSLCLHGDTPEALAMAKAIRQALEERGVSVHSWVAG
ncbi:MAG: LamB/YcsF family protein [Firmicutes bacterium]|nr:LamB/YcsF family protein [Bacillota bacterium]